MAEVPNRPGIGVTIDWDIIEKYRIEPKAKPYPHPGLLLRLDWPTGAKTYFTHARQMWDAFGRRRTARVRPRRQSGPRDATTATRVEGTYEKAQTAPVHEAS